MGKKKEKAVSYESKTSGILKKKGVHVVSQERGQGKDRKRSF